MYGKRTSQILNVVERGFAVIGVALVLAGAALAVFGHRDEGISMMLIALPVWGLWLLTHLYQGRFRI